jgi:hypothetical protein
VPKPLRYTGDWPPPEVLREYPNWVCAWDEEGEEGQDETTLKPEGEQTVITEDTIHTAGEVRLADGRRFPAIISLPDGPPISIDYHDGGAWVRCRVDATTERWSAFVQDWLPVEQRMRTVDFTDTRIFPLRVKTQLPHFEIGEQIRFQIRSDGSQSEPT